MVLFDIHRRRFASRPDHHNGIGPFLNMEVDKLAHGRQIQAAVLMHGGNNGNNRTGNRSHGRHQKIIREEF